MEVLICVDVTCIVTFEELHDGSEGVFADLYLADIPHGIGKEIDIKDMKKVCDFDL